MTQKLGISGKTAQAFQNSAITPLLALVGLLLGFFAIMITPKEEEPQIDVTFANIFIGYPGASASSATRSSSVSMATRASIRARKAPGHTWGPAPKAT